MQYDDEKSAGERFFLFLTGTLAVAILCGVGVIIYRTGLPYDPTHHRPAWYGCTLVASVRTEETRSCGKACTKHVYADTYQCGAVQKTFLNARKRLEDVP